MVFIMIRFILSSNYPLTCFFGFFLYQGPSQFWLVNFFLEASKNSSFIYEESNPQLRKNFNVNFALKINTDQIRILQNNTA